MGSAVVLTDDLSDHEDEADAAGQVELPPGRSPLGGLGRRHGALLPAEAAGPPQAVLAAGVVARLGVVRALVLRRTAAERKMHTIKHTLITIDEVGASVLYLCA